MADYTTVRDRLRRWMQAPQFSDVTTQRNARLINAMLWVILAVLGLQTPLAIFGMIGMSTAAVVVIPLIIVTVAIKLVLNRRHVRLAAQMLVGSWGFIAAVLMLVFGEEPNAMSPLLIVVTLMSGLLLGQLATSLFVVSSIGFVWLVWSLRQVGLLPALLGPFSTLETLIILSSLLVSSAIFVVIMNEDMESSWRKALDELAERRSLQEGQERQAGELSLLHELRTILALEEDLSGIIRQLVDSVQQRFGYSQVGVYLLNVAEQQLEEVYQVGFPVFYPVLPLGEGISSRVFQSGQGELVRDVQADPDFIGVDDVFAEICVPLRLRGEVVGVLNIESMDDDLDKTDLALIESIAGYVNLALERAKLIEELRGERNLLLSLIDAVPSGIYAKDRESRFTLVNQAVVSGFGQHDRAALLGKSDRELVGEDYFEVTRSEELDVMSSGDPLLEKEESGTQDGVYVATSTSKVPLYDAQGELLGIVGTTIDITPRKRAEIAMQQLNEQLEDRVEERTAELQQANRELEAFAYTVSHDLRAPLRAIDGYSAMLLDPAASANGAAEHLGAIRTNIQRMNNLIEGLLNFSRLNRTPLVTMRTDLDALVDEVWTELAPTLGDREIAFRNDGLGECECDKTLMRQVFTNLLSNAAKFTRKQAQPEVHVGGEIRDGKQVFFVRDNGVGFDLKYSSRLFGVFERLHRNDDYEGTGVGLAIVQRIIKRHGGEIWAESTPGEGASFYFSLATVPEKA